MPITLQEAKAQYGMWKREQKVLQRIIIRAENNDNDFSDEVLSNGYVRLEHLKGLIAFLEAEAIDRGFQLG